MQIDFTGADGKPGKDGKNGRNGRPGTQRKDGSRGPGGNGTNGTNGTDGTDGKDAKNVSGSIELVNDTIVLKLNGKSYTLDGKVTVNAFGGTGGTGGKGRRGGSGGWGTPFGISGSDGVDGLDGDGGDGADVTISTKTDPALIKLITISNHGGSGRVPGRDGEYIFVYDGIPIEDDFDFEIHSRNISFDGEPLILHRGDQFETKGLTVKNIGVNDFTAPFYLVFFQAKSDKRNLVFDRINIEFSKSLEPSQNIQSPKEITFPIGKNCPLGEYSISVAVYKSIGGLNIFYNQSVNLPLFISHKCLLTLDESHNVDFVNQEIENFNNLGVSKQLLTALVFIALPLIKAQDVKIGKVNKVIKTLYEKGVFVDDIDSAKEFFVKFLEDERFYIDIESFKKIAMDFFKNYQSTNTEDIVFALNEFASMDRLIEVEEKKYIIGIGESLGLDLLWFEKNHHKLTEEGDTNLIPWSLIWTLAVIGSSIYFIYIYSG